MSPNNTEEDIIIDDSYDLEQDMPKIDKTEIKIEKAQLKFKKLERRAVKREKMLERRSQRKRDLKEKHGAKEFFRKVKNWIPLSKVSGKILIIYLATVFIGGFLLTLPGVVTKSKEWDYITGLFTASSAFSDTGITLIPTNNGYSFWGQLLIIIMIQIGGIGILTFKIVLYIILGKKISMQDQSVAQSERGSSTVSTTVDMIKTGFIFLTCVEIVGMIVLFFGFYFTPLDTTDASVTNPYHDFTKSIWFSIFHSVSATNNAGFDVISGSSLIPYNVDNGSAHGYILQIVFLCQWVIGGLGYPTFYDIKKKIEARKKGQTVKFSLFTKINFVTYSLLFVLGPLFVFISEVSLGNQSHILYNYDPDNHLIGKKEWYVAFMDVVFNVSSTRNAGFSSVDVNHFAESSRVIMSSLMFIGSAPSSTAGGIRTTTFALCLIGIFAIMRNKQTTDAMKKRIPEETVKRSFAVFVISVAIVMIACLIIYSDSFSSVGNTYNGNIPNFDMTNLLVLVASAFGTVGFSPFTSDQMLALGVISKLVLALIMFIGQLGISNTLLAFIKPQSKKTHSYLEEGVAIG